MSKYFTKNDYILSGLAGELMKLSNINHFYKTAQEIASSESSQSSGTPTYAPLQFGLYDPGLDPQTSPMMPIGTTFFVSSAKQPYERTGRIIRTISGVPLLFYAPARIFIATALGSDYLEGKLNRGLYDQAQRAVALQEYQTKFSPQPMYDITKMALRAPTMENMRIPLNWKDRDIILSNLAKSGLAVFEPGTNISNCDEVKKAILNLGANK